MDLLLKLSRVISGQSLKISGSKSETNRLLLLRALYPELEISNVSVSDDSQVMLKALTGNDDDIDIRHAGTAMRFLTAYFAAAEGKAVTITGSARMQQRPIAILVDALRQLGASIEYLGNEGFPPLRIIGKRLLNNKVSIRGEVSSQYISALLLIAPRLENGLELTLKGNPTSRPYIEMTLDLLQSIGVRTRSSENVITVEPLTSAVNKYLAVESDWSSASYFYSTVALSEIGTNITLSSFKKDSFQGDRILAEIYQDFGVETIFEGSSIVISKTKKCQLSIVNCQLNNTPDIAQTIAVTCVGLGLGCRLTGLHTLKIKETDRLAALQNELTKLGAEVSVTDDSLELFPCREIKSNVVIKTYDDHRMAMAFAPLALKVPLVIEDAGVVSKSYPDHWKDLETIGFAAQYCGDLK